MVKTIDAFQGVVLLCPFPMGFLGRGVGEKVTANRAILCLLKLSWAKWLRKENTVAFCRESKKVETRTTGVSGDFRVAKPAATMSSCTGLFERRFTYKWNSGAEKR